MLYINIGRDNMHAKYIHGWLTIYRIHTIRPQIVVKCYIRKFQTENSSVIDLLYEQQQKNNDYF